MAHLNPHIEARLTGLRHILMGVHVASKSLSSATKGGEREGFVRLFLEEFFPRGFRFGHGDITDSSDAKSGQCDIVVEFPFIPSIPLPGGGARLYLSEGVAAVIEVKSNISNQWAEACTTASAVRRLHRKLNPTVVVGSDVLPSIPIFAVGYEGWKTIETAQENLAASDLSAVLIIESGIFVAKNEFFGGVKAARAAGVWAFIASMNEAMSYVKAADPSLLSYCRADEYPPTT